jgi:hypothetical protein
VRQPVGIAPITVPAVVAQMTVDRVVTDVYVDHLMVISGPNGTKDRHAWLRLSANQAEVLMRQIADQLGFTVTS